MEGVLITHAGVSLASTRRCFMRNARDDPALLARLLEQGVVDAAIRRELETGECAEDGILGDDGPSWFRPRPYSHLLPLAGLPQVVGHTPPLPELEAVDFHMIDPCVFLSLNAPGRCRYAVIEDGRVRIEEVIRVPQEVAA